MSLKFFSKYQQCRHFFITNAAATMVSVGLLLLQSQMKLVEFVPTVRESKISSPQFFKFISMGYWPASVDWMWIQTLQVIGGDSHSPKLIPYMSSFYTVATDLDPRFYDLYEQAGVFFSFSLESPDESVHFLEKGIQNFEASGPSKGWTHPYTLHLLAAYVYAYQKNDWAKAKQLYLKAADVPGAPAYLQNMRQWLEEKDSEKKLATRVLKILIQSTSDPILKARYEDKLKAYD